MSGSSQAKKVNVFIIVQVQVVRKRLSIIYLFCLLMGLQDANPNNPNMGTVPIMGDAREGENCLLDSMCRVTVSEAEAGVDLHGHGTVDTASECRVGNDPNFTDTNLPPRTTVHGISTSPKKFNGDLFLVSIFSRHL